MCTGAHTHCHMHTCSHSPNPTPFLSSDSLKKTGIVHCFNSTLPNPVCMAQWIRQFSHTVPPPLFSKRATSRRCWCWCVPQAGPLFMHHSCMPALLVGLQRHPLPVKVPTHRKQEAGFEHHMHTPLHTTTNSCWQCFHQVLIWWPALQQQASPTGRGGPSLACGTNTAHDHATRLHNNCTHVLPGTAICATPCCDTATQAGRCAQASILCGMRLGLCWARAQHL
jgi:hypothetical protein